MKSKSKLGESSPVKAGDILLTEEPFAYVLSSKEKGIRCDYCLKRALLLKCSGCQFVHYCNRVCQKEAWSGHKWECSNLKRIAPRVIPDAARTLAKIINRLTRGDGHSFRAFYSPNSFRMWKDLMSHYSDLKEDKKRMEHLSSLTMVLQEFLGDISLPNAVELMGIYGRVCINSFSVLDSDMRSIGSAIYVGASIVDHSCKPNAVATFDGPTITLRATQDMPSVDWCQVRISYIDQMQTPYERQMELMQNYYFLCQCDLCLDEKHIQMVHSAKCPNTSCDSPIPIEWKDNLKLVINQRTESNDKTRHREKVQGNIGKDTQNSDNEARIRENNTSENNEKDSRFEGACRDVEHCTQCGTKLRTEYVNEFKRIMELTEDHLRNMKNASTTYIDVCKFLLEKQDGVLHSLNVAHAQTLDHAFDSLIELQMWDLACKYAPKLIPCFRTYYGDQNPLTGLIYLKFGKILLYREKALEALECLKKAAKILKLTHGDKHPLYREDILPLLSQATYESQV